MRALQMTKGDHNVIENLSKLVVELKHHKFWDSRPPLKGYSSDQSHLSEINVKLAEKNKYVTHSVQRSLEMCENK